MAGQGPPPKDPQKRSRRNKDVAQLRIVEIQPTPQPDLPDFTVEVKIDGEMVTQEFVWPVMTRDWWVMLAQHPLVTEFIDADWSYLLDTARLHAAYWMGKLDLASELRLREAKYGFTPEDRARLRLQLAVAVSAEVDTNKKVASARDRMRGIKRVGDDDALEA